MLDTWNLAKLYLSIISKKLFFRFFEFFIFWPTWRKFHQKGWKFLKLAILCQFYTKNSPNLGIFRPFFVQNWHKIANFQNFRKSSSYFVPLYGMVIWCKFQLIWPKVKGADTFGQGGHSFFTKNWQYWHFKIFYAKRISTLNFCPN